MAVALAPNAEKKLKELGKTLTPHSRQVLSTYDEEDQVKWIANPMIQFLIQRTTNQCLERHQQPKKKPKPKSKPKPTPDLPPSPNTDSDTDLDPEIFNIFGEDEEEIGNLFEDDEEEEEKDKKDDTKKKNKG